MTTSVDQTSDAVGSDQELAMLRAAELYYYGRLTQAQIAEQLVTSRWTVGRLLEQARETGIVRITIEHPLARHHQLEVELRQQFGVSSAIVVPGQADSSVTLQAVCRAAAQQLTALRPRPKVLGVSWGRTTSRVATALPEGWDPGVTVVQTNGGLAIDGAGHVSAALRTIAERGPGRVRMMPAPTIVQSVTLARALAQDPAVAGTLGLAANARTIVYSPGSATSTSVLIDSGYLTVAEVAQLQRRGVVGDVLSHFVDASGRIVDEELDARTISINLDSLRQCPNSIAVVSGAEKASAARAILAAGLCTTIITDAELAAVLLAG
ncbi:MAG: sugar-binding domain-containing protein [Acidobacteriota bacterium]|nr:sugar-binding domain-containing protein [Acidobacteriota bacterium]